MKNTTITPYLNKARAMGAEMAARVRDDEGATAAEYAVTVLAACAFAAVLFGVVTSGPIQELVLGLITRALGTVA